MDRFIIGKNIERFEGLLTTVTDGDQRRTIKSLLKAERQKAVDLMPPLLLGQEK